MPELKFQVWVVLRRESGLLSFKGSKLEREESMQRPSPAAEGPSEDAPVVRHSGESSDVQHQRRVQRTRLRGLVLWWRRAFVAQHARTAHPPQLGPLPRLLHNVDRPSAQAPPSQATNLW